MLPKHFESHVVVDAAPAEVFAFLDDHRRLSAHMTKSSWMMAGSRMTIKFDEHEGRTLGSKIVLKGAVLGIPLEVAEIITEYNPPSSKQWKTVGSPKLLVIGPYAMGFSIVPQQENVSLRVFIDYSAPSSGVPRVLGRLFGRVYAAWCTNRMANDAAAYFRAGSQRAA
jgi:hypothetical protein